MNKRGIVNAIATIVFFIVILLVIADCTTDQGIVVTGTHVNLRDLNWVQILIGSGFGFLLGFIFSLAIFKRRI
jgi:hypothetical protein